MSTYRFIYVLRRPLIIGPNDVSICNKMKDVTGRKYTHTYIHMYMLATLCVYNTDPRQCWPKTNSNEMWQDKAHAGGAAEGGGGGVAAWGNCAHVWAYTTQKSVEKLSGKEEAADCRLLLADCWTADSCLLTASCWLLAKWASAATARV